MSDNHHSHDHHSNEKKPVAFTVPLIFGSVVMLAIVLFLSLCNPKHGHHGNCECKENCSKECMEACEKGDHSKHPAEVKEETSGNTNEAAETTEPTAEAKKDTVK